MPSFTLRSNRDIAIFVGTVALICNAFVGLAIEVYFPDEIADQILLFGFFCATVLAVPICYLIGIVMRRNAGLTDELARIVNRDRLTDAATRDYFFKQLDGQPDSYGISLMVDIDHFKKVNDTYGHLIGDHAIRHVCRVIKGCIRSTDIVCRFGGEEFVVFLDSLTRAEGEEVAERIRVAVEQEPALSAGVKVAITVSIGGSLKESCDSIVKSIDEADKALYRAKNGGRNLVEFA